ncbi:hypothetical protein P153DRAFT_363210 [Dothidotthia symphoricarpi CBS 119687]|uniref:HCNGP-domain-containing protein n=1 Tax=Dothidotthia symphoricarpi CBS 119687 TaxID=1392245 RepID=A0A6A6AQF6_9PLEO|nr:uncharacterized protein P153DRAFT_363210 [Dothidotthia symphoricarpi CBS 119687]KAF2134232.1 hypothetical protein P153DRAFT_363210 [Dothidotthia symphoricarpi CBS 119687]
MLGINYESSDEEDAVPVAKPEVRRANVFQGAMIATNIEMTNIPKAAATTQKPSPNQPLPKESQTLAGPVNGPSQGPAAQSSPADNAPTSDVTPGSPYTTNRAMIQNLTLPTAPNFDIPPSPPGSPPQQATKKFAQFLELKKKGQHFNQRLQSSSVLRDPGHLRKLMDFAGISEEDQYASTLPEEVAVPTVFPEWAYAEELKASQRQIFKAREQQKSKAPRASVDFVGATKSGSSSGTGMPAGKALRQSAAERVMEGTDGDQSTRSSAQSAGKRKELEHRGKDDATSRSRWKSRSRSPKRRRSQSRDRKR